MRSLPNTRWSLLMVGFTGGNTVTPTATARIGTVATVAGVGTVAIAGGGTATAGGGTAAIAGNTTGSAGVTVGPLAATVGAGTKGNTAWLGLGTFRGAAPLGVCMFARRHCK